MLDGTPDRAVGSDNPLESGRYARERRATLEDPMNEADRDMFSHFCLGMLAGAGILLIMYLGLT